MPATTTADELHQIAVRVLQNVVRQIESPAQPLTATARFVRISEYLLTVLTSPFGGPTVESLALGDLRRRISEKLPAMSLYVAVIRVGFGAAPVADILIDTSDRPRLENSGWNAFGTVLFAPEFLPAVKALGEQLPFGTILVRSQ